LFIGPRVGCQKYFNNQLAKLLREEEVKWYQRAKTKNLLQGYSNTKYFQLVASGKHRKSRIFKLLDENQTIEGDEELKKFITSYYKSLFGPSDITDVTLDESITHDIPRVSEVENTVLTSLFSEEDIKAAIFQMEHNKASGPDGFLAEFYQAFWSVIKHDLMPLFLEFLKENYLCIVLILVQLSCYQNVRKEQLFSSTDLFVY
jgi:hypothetical protein